jgi:hypothetical protein
LLNAILPVGPATGLDAALDADDETTGGADDAAEEVAGG